MTVYFPSLHPIQTLNLQNREKYFKHVDQNYTPA